MQRASVRECEPASPPGVRVFGPTAAPRATQPHSHALRPPAPTWPPSANLGESEKGRTSPCSLAPPPRIWAAAGPRAALTTALGAPLSAAAPSWGRLAPELARPAQPPRRLLPALGAVPSGPARRRALPQLPPPRLLRAWEGAFGPCEPRVPQRPRAGGSGGLANPAAPGTARSARPWMRSRSDAPARPAPPPARPSCLPFGEFCGFSFSSSNLRGGHDSGAAAGGRLHGAGRQLVKSAKPSLA